MALFRCKMCGGTLEIINESVATCEYCGTQQTLPKLNDDRRSNLYDRANHFRRNNEFDKAMSIYEQILNEDTTDAEAYWSLVLCRYGIEYVEDPVSHKRVPTVNRAQFTSIFDDEDYRSALQYADGAQRSVYEEEARAINEIQKGILAISQQEEPFDVFICYKESDSNGRRTPDSVLANDLYHQLTQEGFKVFFARITLEDKLGAAYEPYIFAALNSAKVMVVLGTRPEYFKAVWVRNEWSRYLSLIKQGQKKMLIPAYKDMDPYDLPDEFSHLQAQDMTKLGFMQDLIRGIKKIIGAEEPKVSVVKETVVPSGNASTAPLLKRVFMFLEDGEWSSANEYCEKVLDIDPENAEAYLGKLMVELKVRRQEDLRDQAQPFDDNSQYRKALRFASEKLRDELIGYIEHIKARIEKDRLDGIYARAKRLMEEAKTAEEYKAAAELFESINEHMDAGTLAQQCHETAENFPIVNIYIQAKKILANGTTSDHFHYAHQLFSSISEYRDSAELAQQCLGQAEAIRNDNLLEEARDLMGDKKAESCRKAIKMLMFVSGWKNADELLEECKKKLPELEAVEKDNILKEAIALMGDKKAESCKKAIEMLMSIPGWKDADAHAMRCKEIIEELKAKEIAAEQERERQEELARQKAARDAKRKKIIIAFICAIAVLIALYLFVIVPAMEYNNAQKLLDSGKYDEAAAAFEAMDQYKDSATMVSECLYQKAKALLTSEKYSEALSVFQSIPLYADSGTQIKECKYQIALSLMDSGRYDDALTLFAYVRDYADSATQIKECKYQQALSLMESGRYDEAISEFDALGDYKDSKGRVDEHKENRYQQAKTLMESKEYWEALSIFRSIEGYRDSKEKGTEVLYKSGVWSTIAAGFSHAVGLRADGTVVAVGDNEYGQCDVSSWNDIVAIAAGHYHTVGLRADGTVVAVGENKDGQCKVSAWTDIVAIAAGYAHTVGLRADGTVVAVGYNGSGQCRTSDWTDIVVIAAGIAHTVGLRADGTVVVVGLNDDGQRNTSEWTDIVAIAAGSYHTVGLRADGTVVAVGDNEYGQCDVSSWNDIVAIAAGHYHIVGLRADSTVVADGANGGGQCDVSSWNDIVAIAAGGYHTVGLRADGTVVAADRKHYDRFNTSGWSNIKLPE